MVVQQSWSEYGNELAIIFSMYYPYQFYTHMYIYYMFSFQEYTEEFRDITKGNKSKEALPAAQITLINQRPVNEDLHVINIYLLSGINSLYVYLYIFFLCCRNIQILPV